MPALRPPVSPQLPEALLINVLSKIQTVWDTGGNMCRGVETGFAEWRDPQAPSKSSHPLARPSPPTHTPRLVSSGTIACSFITAQEVALYWLSQSCWGQQEGEGLVMQGRAAQSRNFH